MNHPSSTPKKIGDYEVLSVLGSGGMGRVYKVRNQITDRIEAMKVLLPDLEGHEEVAARFLREIKVLAGLKHPNIATLHTALTIDNQLVMIMEYVEGQSLSSRVNHGPIPSPEALNYLDQILSALSYAHQRRVIHRDIKPANMMLTPDGMVKLMDFGIARTEDEPNKLTAPGSTLGSMNYMSPEQIKGETTDERSDLYSLGISLYEMVTGAKPFDGDSNFSIMAAHINQPPKPPMELFPELPNAVNDLILTSIAKAPEQRFQSADAFRFAVQRVAKSLQEDKTFVQGSQDTTITGSAMPQVQPRTVPFVAPAAQASPPAVARPQSASPQLPPPIPQMPAVAARPSSSRGLYMVLGAAILMAVIIAGATYLPGRKKASAAEATEAKPETATTSSAAASAPATPAPMETTPAAEPKPVAPAPKNVAPAATASVPAAAVQSAVNTAELDEIEHEIDQLTSRAAAVNTGLDNLQRQQAAAGYGLRGDMAAKQSSMKVNLAKAQSAIAGNDAARAKRYAEMATKDVETLERFLGR
ncbi:MAG TPA: serine/threonine-protein kinase [Terriglobales bacterium]|nr:serine/threonine-protein kinase [Terriglobales bacterium]